MDICFLDRITIALNNITHAMEKDWLDCGIFIVSCFSAIITLGMVYGTKKTISEMQKQNKMNILPCLFMSNFIIKNMGVSIPSNKKFSEAGDRIKDYDVSGLELINVGNGNAKNIKCRFHFEQENIKSYICEKLENDNEEISYTPGEVCISEKNTTVLGKVYEDYNFLTMAIISGSKIEIKKLPVWYLIVFLFLLEKSLADKIPILKIELTFLDICDKKYYHYFTANCITPMDICSKNQVEFEVIQCDKTYTPISTD